LSWTFGPEARNILQIMGINICNFKKGKKKAPIPQAQENGNEIEEGKVERPPVAGEDIAGNHLCSTRTPTTLGIEEAE